MHKDINGKEIKLHQYCAYARKHPWKKNGLLEHCYVHKITDKHIILKSRYEGSMGHFRSTNPGSQIMIVNA